MTGLVIPKHPKPQQSRIEKKPQPKGALQQNLRKFAHSSFVHGLSAAKQNSKRLLIFDNVIPCSSTTDQKRPCRHFSHPSHTVGWSTRASEPTCCMQPRTASEGGHKGILFQKNNAGQQLCFSALIEKQTLTGCWVLRPTQTLRTELFCWQDVDRFYKAPATCCNCESLQVEHNSHMQGAIFARFLLFTCRNKTARAC